MTRPLKELAKTWRLSREVVLTQRECAKVASFARLVSGGRSDALVLRNPDIVYAAPEGAVVGAKRRLDDAFAPGAKRLRPDPSLSVPVRADLAADDFDPVLPRVTRPPAGLRVQVAHRGRKVVFRHSRAFARPDTLRVIGELEETGSRVLVELWDSGGLSGPKLQRQYRIATQLPLPFPKIIVRDGYHPSMTRVKFEPARLVLSSFPVEASARTMPVFPGLHVYCPFEFDPALERYVPADDLRALRVMGDFGVRGDAEFVSTPFRLELPHFDVDRCALHITAAGEPRYIDEVIMQGEWVWKQQTPFRLKLWTEVTPLDGVLSFHSDAETFPSAYDDEGRMLAQPHAGWPRVTLGVLDELLGGWDGWRAEPAATRDASAMQLESAEPLGLAAAWVEPRLAGYTVNVDTANGAETAAIATVYAPSLRLKKQYEGVHLGPCVSQIVVLQPWEAGRRVVHLATSLHARVGERPFAGQLSADGILSLEPTDATTPDPPTVQIDLRAQGDL